MSARAAIVVLALLPACYSPTIPDCAYTCAADVDCPEGLTCDLGMHACRPAGAAGACGPHDGGPNIGFAPSNYTSADLGGLPATVLTVTSETTLDTDIDMPGSTLLAAGSAASMRLVHVASLSIESGAVLTVSGSHPLILAVDGAVDIAGAIAVLAGTRTCPDAPGNPGVACSAGGGGGAFGTGGGEGGSCEDATGSPGEQATITELVPLVGGCGGGDAATVNAASGATGGSGGTGGGALEISAAGGITIDASGGIAAPGGGGGGGQSFATNDQPGGGGGGAGGGILLEGPEVNVHMMGFVCASGGGGGAAAHGTGTISAGGAGDNGCSRDNTGGLGAPGELNNDGNGGEGAPTATGPAGGTGIGAVTAPGDAGGGGGGGGVGLIFVRAHTATVPAASFIPAPQMLTF